MAEVVKISESHFQNLVLSAETPVLVDFYADWCPPCRMLKPILEELAQEWGPKVRVLKVNADDDPQLAAKFGVSGLPTVLLFNGGEVKANMVGLQPKSAYVKAVESL